MKPLVTLALHGNEHCKYYKYGFKQKFTLQYIDLILANSWWKVFGVWLPQYIICTSENTLQAVLPLEGKYHGP